MGTVNCYLMTNGSSRVLIDTGGSNNRRDLVTELNKAGCSPGDLKLIVLTHGDFDHTGNAAYLQGTFGARIAMHGDDSEMVKSGDMFSNRKKPNVVIRKLIPILSGFGRSERFSPDSLLEDGYDLSGEGLDARVVSIPGHSRGSIGILTDGGEFICGDLFENTTRPALNSIMDDSAAANASVDKLKGMGIHTVYPGHGKPFPMEWFL